MGPETLHSDTSSPKEIWGSLWAFWADTIPFLFPQLSYSKAVKDSSDVKTPSVHVVLITGRMYKCKGVSESLCLRAKSGQCDSGEDVGR